MAIYDKKEIFEQSKQLAKEKKLLSMQDIIDFLPLSESRFYDFFPKSSEELEILRKILNKNKVSIKTSMRAKWYNSENPTLQMALYRLAANADEHRQLNQHYIDHTSDGKGLQINIIEAKDE